MESLQVARCDTTGEGSRLDSESCTFITHSLRGEGFDASEDGTGRGTPLVPVAMRESGQGYWMQDDLAGTLRAEGEDRPSRPSHVIGVPVGVTLHGTDGTQPVASLTDISSSLRARIPSGVENSTTTAVMQPVGIFQDSEYGVQQYDSAGTLRAGRIPEHQMVMQPVAFSIMPMNSGKDYKAREVDVAQPLMAGGPVGGNQGGDFIAQPVPMINMQGSKGNAVAQADGPSFTLKAMHGHDVHAVAVPVAQPYTLAIRGRGDSHNLEYRQDGTANALLTPNGGRGGIGVGAIAVPDVAPTMDQRAGRSGANSFATSGGLVPVAFHPTQDPISSTEVCHAIGTGNGQECATAAVAVTSKGNGEAYESDVTNALCSAGGGQAGQGYIAARVGMQVRRLTPVECERLQGFPDGYTAIPWRKKPASECPDGPRYKALGNSWAVPVVRWIGRRIQSGIDA